MQIQSLDEGSFYEEKHIFIYLATFKGYIILGLQSKE